MKRLTILLTMILLAMSSVPAGMATANQVGATSVEEMVLTIAEDDAWSYSTGANGEPMQNMVAMMVEGEPQLDFAPAVLDMYERHQLENAYAWSADLRPQYYEPISTTIEIRVMQFASDENASEFLNEFYDQLVELSAPEAQVAGIDPLPESKLNLLGITSMVDFTSYESGESMGMAGSARYLAQVNDTVISVQVTGPFVDYNFDIAFWLLEAQADCVTTGTLCEPTPMPNGDGRWQLTERGIVFLTEGDVGNDWARWIFPLENPVPAPEWSVTIP